MYTTCLHCNRKLGANESIELFPVGRRIAFDASRGRLWAICRACERWNLSPIEERWEAIEECEKRFRDTGVRVSTDNIGLAKLRDGTELVRVGKPMRPEFAAWRYGDQFGRRQRKRIMIGTGIAAGAGMALAGAATLGVSLVAITPMIHLVSIANILSNARRVGGMTSPLPDGRWFLPMGTPRLVARSDVPEGWGIVHGHGGLFDTPKPPPAKSVREWLRNNQASNDMPIGEVRIRGNDATGIMRRVLPRVNSGGASRGTVAEGVGLIERAGGAEDFGTWAASQLRTWSTRQTFGDSGDLAYIPAPARLAFEMALHEESERRALEGELAVLEQAWRQAEEIAGIADGLLIAPSVNERMGALRNRSDTNSRP
ncbi:MAG TPA: hypothetical protein VE869_01530 [Gemmatimonas sp.]|nr:hypothetical protein [Gemmatimonas sp.]